MRVHVQVGYVTFGVRYAVVVQDSIARTNNRAVPLTSDAAPLMSKREQIQLRRHDVSAKDRVMRFVAIVYAVYSFLRSQCYVYKVN